MELNSPRVLQLPKAPSVISQNSASSSPSLWTAANCGHRSAQFGRLVTYASHMQDGSKEFDAVLTLIEHTVPVERIWLDVSETEGASYSMDDNQIATEQSALLPDLRRLCGCGRAFCTQIGHTGPLKRSETGRLIPYLEDVLLDFPELVVVAGHVGFPWIDELVTLTVKFQNFYVDTSAYALHRLPPAFVAWMKGIGKSRVMFGTNWPMLSPRRCLEGLNDLGLSDEQTENFLSSNVRRVFKL
jgi:hypothetical protein